MRNLASIQQILSISPIEGADKIEKVQVLGWECVVQKAEKYNVGDLVVYIEIDSVVPDKPVFDFLRDKKFRVRTIKLRGQVSQGLVLPLSVLPKNRYSYHIGDDVTEVLGVKKYDPEGDKERKLIEAAEKRTKNQLNKFLFRLPFYKKVFYFLTKKRTGFPSFIHKTDETRVQLYPNICEQEANTYFYVTEKLDGQSATYFLIKNPRKWEFWKKYIFGVCSRNFLLPKPDSSSYWKVAKKYSIETELHKLLGDNAFVAIQGEIIGPGIQKNKYKRPEYEFYVFNLIFPTGAVNPHLNLDIKLTTVPLLKVNVRLPNTISAIIESAKGISTLENIQREGLVYRNYSKNLSFKAINPDFLLKYQDEE